jgi:GrpB-like predicted nucleotidyltransferase (UPF0157 family)
VTEVVPYDPEWPLLFERARAELEDVLSLWLDQGIHHVGSTSVSGLEAKPIIDMLAGVKDLEQARAAFGPLEGLGYSYLPHRPEAHRFERLGYHLHLTEPGSDLWRERLAFRDALRGNAELRREYADWKREHATSDPGGGPYDDSKRAFVARVLAGAGIALKPDDERLSPQD